MRTIDRLPVSEPLSEAAYSAAELSADGRTLYLLEQRRLPLVEEYVAITTPDDAAEAIRAMVVRGAPAIGVAAAYAMVLAAHATGRDRAALAAAGARLADARPTAVNLGWAIARMLAAAERDPSPEALAAEARAIHREDVAACRRIGELGATLLGEGSLVLTHCNAGALATGGYGTALGVIRAAYRAGRIRGVLANETRPYLQGARLTAWELAKDGIPVTLLTDGMAAHFMARGEIGGVVVGADRIARNGDVANKIGTYAVAVCAHAHELPMLVAAPWSTVDLACANGGAIPIEERSSDEVTTLHGQSIAPPGVSARHPAFDVTPARLVTAIVTERGVASPPSEATVRALDA